MSKLTQTAALRKGLLDRGFTIAVRQTTRKYTILKAPTGATMTENFYLGRGSALRYGRTVASSLPVTDSWRRKIITEGMGMEDSA